MSKDSKIKLYDTTLRDGTQGEGINFSSLDKIRIAKELDSFGMDYIEGGWPGSNPKDISFFEKAKDLEWKNSKIVAFGSTRRKNVKIEEDPQIDLLLKAKTPVVTFFGKSWLLHVTDVLNTIEEENRAMIFDTAYYLKNNGKEVIYDAEHFFDGYKDSKEFALSTLISAKEGGADWIVLCDTNGGTMPSEIAQITKEVIDKLDMPVGIHSHNDSGVGVANALSAIESGAMQVQGTINGYGERVGNCNLTTLIPNIHFKLKHNIVKDIKKISHLSYFIDDIINYTYDPRAPYVGSSAFAHKGGMHVNAVEKIDHSFEHIKPEEVGNKQRILVSELSGQSNILMKAKELGLRLEKGSQEVKEILKKVKTLEDQGYSFESAEASLELLIKDSFDNLDSFFELTEYSCNFKYDDKRNYNFCNATLKLLIKGKEEYCVCQGAGPVNALDGAIRKALLPSYPGVSKMKLEDYKVRIIDSHMGTAAKTRVIIYSSDGVNNWSTVGVDFNIIQASWKALSDSFRYFLSL